MIPNTKCKICGRDFYARPSFLKIGWGKYCSKKCQYKSFKTGKKFKCFVCGKDGYRVLAKISHSKSGKFFCSKSCQTKWRNTQFIGPLHKNWKGGFSTYRDILEREGKIKKCALCGENDKRVLAVHHKDHNHKNNKINNLSYLCHNCHYLVHHDKLEEKKFMEVLV